MSKEKAIEKIQYAVMQVASVYPYSAIFDEKDRGNRRQTERT